MKRVSTCRGADRTKVARRFLPTSALHRDLRRLEATQLRVDGVNLIATDKLRELSAINHTLYEFLLPEEQKPAEQRSCTTSS